MLPCRLRRNSLSQKQLRTCRWDTYIKGGWRRQKYRRRSQFNCCYRKLVQQHHFNRLFRYICDVQFSERLNKVWCTFFSTKFRNMFHLVLFFFKAAKHFNWCSNLSVGNQCFPGMTLAVIAEGVFRLFWRSARPPLCQLAWYTWLKRIQSQWLWVSISSIVDTCWRLPKLFDISGKTKSPSAAATLLFRCSLWMSLSCMCS